MKQGKFVRLNLNVFNHLEKNPFINSFSEWVEQKYIDEFMQDVNSEQIKEQINKLTELEQLNKSLKTTHTLINDSEKDFILNDLFKRDYTNNPEGVYCEGVYKFFINQFNRRDLSKKQFHLILDELKKE